MTEPERIADQLLRVLDGDPWYGPSVHDVLRGVSAAQARQRPLPEAHSVWELVLHMTSWNREVLRRLRTGVAREPEDGDWPAVPEPEEENWRFSRMMLDAGIRELAAAAAALPPERLEAVPGEARDRPLGSGVTFYVMLHGIVQHNVAHTAQISMLRKALAPVLA